MDWNLIKWPNGIWGIFKIRTLRNLNPKRQLANFEDESFKLYKIERIGIKSNDLMELRGTLNRESSEYIWRVLRPRDNFAHSNIGNEQYPHGCRAQPTGNGGLTMNTISIPVETSRQQPVRFLISPHCYFPPPILGG